jgi:hypothetical protein
MDRFIEICATSMSAACCLAPNWPAFRSGIAANRRTDHHALAYNLGNFMRTLAMLKAAEPWSLTSLREKLIKIGAKVVSPGATSRFKWPRSPRRSRCYRTGAW